MTTAELKKMAERARRASYELQVMKPQDKEIELLKCAEYLSIYKDEILTANAADIERATENGMHPGMIDRLRLDDARIEAMADGLRAVVKLKDPVGEVMEEFTCPKRKQTSKLSAMSECSTSAISFRCWDGMSCRLPGMQKALISSRIRRTGKIIWDFKSRPCLNPYTFLLERRKKKSWEIIGL